MSRALRILNMALSSSKTEEVVRENQNILNSMPQNIDINSCEIVFLDESTPPNEIGEKSNQSISNELFMLETPNDWKGSTYSATKILSTCSTNKENRPPSPDEIMTDSQNNLELNVNSFACVNNTMLNADVPINKESQSTACVPEEEFLVNLVPDVQSSVCSASSMLNTTFPTEDRVHATGSFEDHIDSELLPDDEGSSGTDDESEGECNEGSQKASDESNEQTVNKKRKVRGTNKRQENKKLRMHGKQYVGFRRPSGQRNTFQDTKRYERKMGPRCMSNACRNSSVRKCNEIKDQDF